MILKNICWERVPFLLVLQISDNGLGIALSYSLLPIHRTDRASQLCAPLASVNTANSQGFIIV